MRDTPPGFNELWNSGDFIGPNRPMARVTVGHTDVVLTDLGYNLYASIVFGKQTQPKELPNVKSVKWNRSIDNEVAACTIEFYNTAPQPLGTVFHPEYGLDQPGYYTFDHGRTSFSSRWGHAPNEWSNLLVPDNILRTYEGYGFDPDAPPETDRHLMPSGVWLIKDVTYTVAGLITVQCDDLASILKDQICFFPVIPHNFYPLTFSSEPKMSGFKDGYTYTKTETATSTDPRHPAPGDWTGPDEVVPNVSVSGGLNALFFDWDAVPAPPAGYKVVGYNLIVDGVRLGEVIAAPPNGLPLAYTSAINSGNVYTGQVAVIYIEDKTGHEHVGPYGTAQYAYPTELGTQAQVTAVLPNVGPPPIDNTQGTVPVPGMLAWDFTGSADQFVIIAFKNGLIANQPPTVNMTVSANGAGRQYFDTGISILLETFSILVYPKTNGLAGRGFLYQGSGEFYMPPTNGAAPHQPNPAQPSPVVTTKAGTTVPLKPTPVSTTYSASSNAYYVGSGKDVEVYGHAPEDAFDSSPSSYWLSIGNERNDQGYSYEWIEAKVPNVELAQVKYTTAKTGYGVYVSVFAKGKWVHYSKTAIIPYDPLNPESHNGANIPYCATGQVGKSEGPHIITFKTPIPGATKVRLTFHNLQDFGVGVNHYRAGVRNFDCFAGGTKSTGPTTTTTTPPPVAGPPQDDNDPAITKTFEVFVPPAEAPGAGERPGLYEDFTDIIKLFCAWGGFYWPQDDANMLHSDGTSVHYDFGPEIFGLKNVDPVLGDQSAGRVWGDFMTTGRAGVASFTVDIFDKKPLLDCINVIRDLIGYLFYIDEGGGVVWRMPNIFSVGNYKLNLASDPGRTSEVITIDEKHTLLDLRAKLSSRNVRERVFVADLSGQVGALSKGFQPNPIGLRRVVVWTDAHWNDNVEAQIAGDFIALRQLMAYRIDTLQIPAHLGIQVDDQVRIFERVTGEGYLHYVRGISSNNDLEQGVYTYDLDTNWLGEDPFNLWIFHGTDLSAELQAYLAATQILPDGAQDPAGSNSPPADAVPPPGPTSNPPAPIGTATPYVEAVVKLVKVTGVPPVYVTDGITYRWVRNATDQKFLVDNKLVPTGTPAAITAGELAFMQRIGPAPS